MGVWSGIVGVEKENRRMETGRVLREKASKKALKFKLIKRQVLFHCCL